MTPASESQDFKPRWGDKVRARCTAHARYLGDGLCLYVSSMSNDLGIDQVAGPLESEYDLPLPTDRELAAAWEGLCHGKT